MPTVDCSCRGINPDCENCSGRGYYDPDMIVKTYFVARKEKKEENEPSFSELICDFSVDKIKKLIDHIVVKIDNKSQHQKRIIENIPINTKKIHPFRKAMKILNSLENDKKDLKNKLIICQQKVEQFNLHITPVFKHELSNDLVDWLDMDALKEKHWEYYVLSKKLLKN